MRGLYKFFKALPLTPKSWSRISGVSISQVVILITSTTFFLLLLGTLANQEGTFEYAVLAKSFSVGRLDLINPNTDVPDISIFQNKYFLPHGPLPAVIILPLAYILDFRGLASSLLILQFAFSAAIYFLIYKLARKLEYKIGDAHFWAFAFLCASAYIGVAFIPFASYFAHVVCVPLLFMAMIEFTNKKRPLLIGIFIGLSLAARFTTLLNLIPFTIFYLFTQNTFSKKVVFEKLSSLYKLFVPVILSLCILFLYNYKRFGNIFETGYPYQTLVGVSTLIKAREYGQINLIHIPGNLYLMLFAVPIPILRDGISKVLKYPYIEADFTGMSIFVTSPYLFYLVILKYKDLISKAILINTMSIAFAVSMFSGMGLIQYGYRFSLDFMPFLFFLLMRNYKMQFGNLDTRFKFIIILSGLVNIYLLPFG